MTPAADTPPPVRRKFSHLARHTEPDRETDPAPFFRTALLAALAGAAAVAGLGWLILRLRRLA